MPFQVNAIRPHPPAESAGAEHGSKWARIAIRATEAKTRLLQDINLINRTIGTLFIDDGQRADRTPTGAELQKLFEAITVTDAELVSEAETHWKYGDQAAAEAAAHEARDSAHEGE